MPTNPAGRAIPLWQDVIAAGIAVAAYGVFFSMPLSMLPWPIAMGMLAHALRWVALALFGASLATGAFVTCFIAGLVLTPVSQRWHMPFAAIGFASVVSMMPGVYIFRTAGGVLQIYSGSKTALKSMEATFAGGTIATTIILTMSLGLIIPNLAIDRFNEKERQSKP